MPIPEVVNFNSMKDQVSPEEWEARVNLAACYRLVAHYGWDDLIANHISMRVPGPEEHFLLNPFGLMFQEITASSLVKIDLAGNKISESPYKINKAGYIIHSAIHEARPDVMCVFHTHSTSGMAVSAHKDGLLPLAQSSMVAMSSLTYHDYEGVAVNPEEKARLVADLGNEWTMILRNHGLLTCGISAVDAFYRLYFLERACDVQVAALGGGASIQLPSEEVVALTKKQGAGAFGKGANLAWPALLRMMDAKDSSFRD